MNDKALERKLKRMCGKKFFITWSQCPIDKQVCYDFVWKSFPLNIERLCIGQEKHQDGNSHLHGAVWFKTRVDFADGARKFDMLHEGRVYHPNWSAIKKDDKCQVYVCKDGDVLANFNWLEWKSKREGTGKKAKVFDEVINKKRALHEVIKEIDLGMIAGYSRLKKDLEEFNRDSKAKRMDLPGFLPNPWQKILPSNNNTKRRHYWIWSRDPNKGKTTKFAEPLEETYRVVIKSGDFSYWRVEEDTQCVIMDDYNGAGVKYYVLNQMCDGSYEYRVFMGGLIKLKKPLILVLGNKPISEIYPFMNNLLYERFNEIEI